MDIVKYEVNKFKPEIRQRIFSKETRCFYVDRYGRHSKDGGFYNSFQEAKEALMLLFTRRITWAEAEIQSAKSMKQKVNNLNKAVIRT